MSKIFFMLVKEKCVSWIPFYEKILFEATKDETYSADVIFLGERIQTFIKGHLVIFKIKTGFIFFKTRVWTMKKGQRIILRIKKSEKIEEGATVSFEFCVFKDWKTKKKISWVLD